MVRPLVRLLSVRDVAAALSVSRATVYSLVKAGELDRVWVGASIRVLAESLESYVERRRE
ncbi:MAG: helix-turn-helix domain-containing protein [Archangium sp.]|nr:helix-turn-helix domain-containing protein [Archangium sp.]